MVLCGRFPLKHLYITKNGYCRHGFSPHQTRYYMTLKAPKRYEFYTSNERETITPCRLSWADGFRKTCQSSTCFRSLFKQGFVSKTGCKYRFYFLYSYSTEVLNYYNDCKKICKKNYDQAISKLTRS